MSEQRRSARQMKAVMAARKINQMLGPRSSRDAVEDIRVASIGAVAEARAVMQAMIAKGLISEAEREDFLDAGYTSVLDQVSNAAGKIFVESAGNG
jgi:hypothetical protein